MSDISKSTGLHPWSHPKVYFSIKAELDLGRVKGKGINMECWKHSTELTPLNNLFGIGITHRIDSAGRVNCFGRYQTFHGVD